MNHSDLDDFLAEEMQDPEFRAAFERISPLVSFGNALARTREQRGMTQKQLAAATGIQRSVIARLESGDHAPTLTTQAKLAHALNVRIEVYENGRVEFVPARTRRTTDRRVTRTATA